MFCSSAENEKSILNFEIISSLLIALTQLNFSISVLLFVLENSRKFHLDFYLFGFTETYKKLGFYSSDHESNQNEH